MTPSQSRRHHSPRINKWCDDDELLALVLQMIVSPTLNSLSQDLDLVERRFEWKATWREDLSGKQLGEDSYGRNAISWPQHKCRWFSLRKSKLEV